MKVLVSTPRGGDEHSKAAGNEVTASVSNDDGAHSLASLLTNEL